MTRPAVAWFAEQMEKKLQANEHKADWSEGDVDYLFRRLLEEVMELHEACVAKHYSHGATSDEIAMEAADVANFAMMIATSGSFAHRGRAAK